MPSPFLYETYIQVFEQKYFYYMGIFLLQWMKGFTVHFPDTESTSFLLSYHIITVFNKQSMQ